MYPAVPGDRFTPSQDESFGAPKRRAARADTNNSKPGITFGKEDFEIRAYFECFGTACHFPPSLDLSIQTRLLLKVLRSLFSFDRPRRTIALANNLHTRFAAASHQRVRAC